jgi:hypothetical protein
MNTDSIVLMTENNEIGQIDELFDYQLLDQETATFVQIKTEQIREKHRLVLNSIIEIGEKMIEVKNRLPHGQFGAWLKNELKLSGQTAKNYMDAAKSHEWDALSPESQDNIAVSGLYYLSSSNISAEVRQEVVERANNGEKITKKKAQEIAKKAQHSTIAYKEKVINNQLLSENLTPSNGNFNNEDIIYSGEVMEWVSPSGETFTLKAGDKVTKSGAVLNDKSKVIVKLPDFPASSVTVDLSDLNAGAQSSRLQSLKPREFTLNQPDSDKKYVFCTFYDKNHKNQYRLVFKGNISDNGTHTVYLDELSDQPIEEYAENLLGKIYAAYLETVVEDVEGWKVGDAAKLIEIDNSRYEQYVGRVVMIDKAKADGSLWVYLTDLPTIRFYAQPSYLIPASEFDEFFQLSPGELVVDKTTEKLGVVLANMEGTVKIRFASRIIKNDDPGFFEFVAKSVLSMSENIDQIVNLACDVFDNKYIFSTGDFSENLTNENLFVIGLNSEQWVNDLIAKIDKGLVKNAIAVVDLQPNSIFWQEAVKAAHGVCFLQGGQTSLTVLFFGQSEIFVNFKRAFSVVGAVLELV